ncbi:MAG: hypothetical protein RR614_05975 [Eubacterium sp.]
MTQIICDGCGKEMTDENQYGLSLYQRKHAILDSLDQVDQEDFGELVEMREEKELCSACAKKIAQIFI